MESGVKIRNPPVLGSSYPEDKETLKSLLKKFFSKAKESSVKKKIKALIVPHAGYMFSGQTAAYGYSYLPKTEKQHFVLIGPTHSYYFDGLASSSCLFWQTPLGKVKQIPIESISNKILTNDQYHHQEHCLEVQLPLLQYLFHDFSVTCLLTGQKIDFKKTTSFLLKSFPNSIFIFSSDLSHYLPQKLAQIKDYKTIDKILDLDEEYFLSEENVACGSVGIVLLVTMAKKAKLQGKLLYYDTSATTSGDKSSVVGYTAMGFF